MRDRSYLIFVGLAVLAAYFVWNRPEPKTPEPVRAPSPVPEPVKPAPPKPAPPRPGPCPGPGPCPAPKAVQVQAKVGGNRHEDGTELQCDLPGGEHLKNKGGRDGAGLCVFTSIDHSARWQNVYSLVGFRDWMTKYPGGGYPEKVKKQITAICKEKGVEEPEYLQVESNDLDILRAACASGRMPAVTYAVSPTGRYGGKRISHMVSLVHADQGKFCILDNNYPGVDAYEWMTPEEFLKAYSGGRKGWAVILLSPPPPPPPKN